MFRHRDPAPTDESDAREAMPPTASTLRPGADGHHDGISGGHRQPVQLGGPGHEWGNLYPPPNYYTYHWAAADVDISDQAEADFPADGGQISLDQRFKAASAT